MAAPERWRRTEAGEIVLALEGAVAALSLAEDGSVRLRARAGGELPAPLEPALGREPWRPVAASCDARAEGGLLLAHRGPRGEVRVELDLSPLALRVRDRTGALVAALDGLQFGERGGARMAYHARAAERFFGFGERSGGLDKRGQRLYLRNRDPELRPGGPRYVSIPFVLGWVPGEGEHRVRGLLLDAFGPCTIDAAAADEDRVWLETGADGLDLTLFPGPGPADVLRRFTACVGRTPLPPLWALGHHQSRWGYRSAEDVRRVVRELRARGIPSDAVHLDIDYMRDYRVFTWHPERFPKPAELLAELREQGVRVVTIVDPGVKVDPEWDVYREGLEGGFYCTRAAGDLYTLRVWPGEAALPDFGREEVRRWWARQHRPLLEAGVSGIWNDMNEPAGWKRDVRLGRLILPWQKQDTRDLEQVDPLAPERRVAHERVRNLYGLQECRATHEALEQARPEQRPFVLTRSGTTGIQRHAAVWTGDNLSRWSDLRESIPMLLNLSLSGVPFCGADVGGFMGHCTPELYARWIQLGALYPFARTHSMWLKRRQEPWSFGPRVEAVARAALELRMRLMPYLYGLFRESEASGAPIWRPLFYEFPDEPEAAGIDDQLMLGPSLLVAPVLEKGARERALWLPPGRWMAWHDDAQYVGPRRLRVEAPLERLPLFLRAGSVVPTRSPVQHAAETPVEPNVLEVVPGDDAAATLVEDDGETTAYRDGAVARTAIRLWDRAGGRLRLLVGRRQGGYPIPERTLRVVVRGCPPPLGVTLDGRRVERRDAVPGYRLEDGRLTVSLLDRGESHTLEVDPSP